MDWILGAVSIFWDGAFKIEIFPAYMIFALSVGRRSEWVMLMTLSHAIFMGSIDAKHFFMFSLYAILNYIREYASRSMIIVTLFIALMILYRFSIPTLIVSSLSLVYVLFGGMKVEE